MIDADRLYNTIIEEIDPISISMDGGEMRGMMRTIIAAEPTIEAVPIDKLCDWLAEKAVFFANDNDSDPEAWKETIKECVMEGERETD